MTDDENAEPAPESWRGDDGLREALAGRFQQHGMDWAAGQLLAADLLALPEVAALRAKAAAADRVREGIEVLSRHRGLLVADDLWAALADLQRTLDGDPEC